MPIYMLHMNASYSNFCPIYRYKEILYTDIYRYSNERNYISVYTDILTREIIYLYIIYRYSNLSPIYMNSINWLMVISIIY